MSTRPAVLVAALALAMGCSGGGSTPDEAEPAVGPNPFLEEADPGKADTGYQNPDGIEVEVNFEADVTASKSKLKDAPAELGQYAMTYLRKNERMYLESWAEIATSEQTVEWLVDGVWLTAAQALAGDTSKLTHFRLRGLNAILLNKQAKDVAEGQVVTALVPRKPYSTFSDLGASCADVDPHYPIDQTYYWDAWNPDKEGCSADAYQEARITITKVLPAGRDVYPEYDQLVSDGKITTVMFFGQMGDSEVVGTRDEGWWKLKEMSTWLTQAGFQEIKPAPVGRRFSKTVAGVVFEMDLYGPTDFRGLEDNENYPTFQKALLEHEIIVYDGHSVLGGSDFWSRPQYPDFYQIYLYGGCLGYEYYLRPILEGKGGWQKLDLLSAVIEVSATTSQFAGPVLARIMWAVQHEYKATWRNLVTAVRKKVGDSTFGVSGVKDNCFSPLGSICGPSPQQDWTRDVLRTDLSIDLSSLEGIADITLAPSTSTAASFSIGDLTVLEVTGPQGPLQYVVGAQQMNVTVPPSTTPLVIHVRYDFVRHTSLKGYSQGGFTMLWPSLCGYLYPCKPNPDDGLQFSLNVTGVPSGEIAVYPSTIDFDAPSYMIALAVGDYQKLDLGTTTAGTQVSAWYYSGDKTAAVAGTKSLTAAFDWLEKTYGPYPFGKSVGSVSANWQGGGFGGMEHHPYWHVGRGAMSDEETHVHEAAHGWFGDGVRIRCWEDFVASEGTTSYVAARALEAVEGASAGQALWDSYEQRLSAAVAAGNTPAWPQNECNEIDIATHPIWSDIPYMKGAFFLRAIEQQVGRAALDKALAAYFKKYVGLAATTGNLIDTIHLETGFDPEPLADAWLRGLEVPQH
ncbi:MAG: hypothetical protein HY898_06565 [Deltaproteobacteria bacterium]|nr:hypothetical protein [Deltaproteobacteria bacterium]